MLRILETWERSIFGCGLLLTVLLPLDRAYAYDFSVLYSFTGGADGVNPLAGVILDKHANVYGTTPGGGIGYGVVFELTPKGAETVLRTFAAPPNDGTNPEAGLLMDKKGNLYGTTDQGGAFGYGAVFKLAPNGTETILHSFAGSPNDGANPQAGLIEDKKGNLYGTTNGGGTNYVGTVFKLAPNGKETVLHNFKGGADDGSEPEAGLLADAAGNLYGTSVDGGPGNFGTIFEIAPNGSETILHAFAGASDGAFPHDGLIADKAGNFYGTAANGGPNGAGTVFKLAPSGTLTVLYFFTSGNDGGAPFGGVIADGKGNLYGTTVAGGTYNWGTVFMLAPNGIETVLYDFADASDGAFPYAGLAADAKGNLYGTTYYAGGHGYGAVFKLTR